MLLLDEMLPSSIAARLTDAGCDTVAISAQPDLRSTPDADVLEIAAQQGRVLVTDNVQDFAPLSSSWAAAGRAHPGILMISSKTFPMTRARSRLIAAALLKRHSSHTWPAPGQFEFLSP